MIANMRSRSGTFFMRLAAPPTLHLRGLLDAFLRILTDTDTTLAEFGSSSTLLVIGAILTTPLDVLQRDVPLFHMLLDVLPHHLAWAAVFLALGAFQSYANIQRRAPRRRRAALLACAFFGFFGSLGLTRTPAVLILGGMFLVHALVQGLVYLRLGLHDEAAR